MRDFILGALAGQFLSFLYIVTLSLIDDHPFSKWAAERIPTSPLLLLLLWMSLPVSLALAYGAFRVKPS